MVLLRISDGTEASGMLQGESPNYGFALGHLIAEALPLPRPELLSPHSQAYPDLANNIRPHGSRESFPPLQPAEGTK